MINNIGFNSFNTIPNNYKGKQLDKTDVSEAAASEGSSFADKLSKTCRSSGTSKVDTIELSRRPAAISLSQVRDSIVSEISQDSDAKYVENLKTQLSTNQYKIDSQDLAKIMLLGDNS